MASNSLIIIESKLIVEIERAICFEGTFTCFHWNWMFLDFHVTLLFEMGYSSALCIPMRLCNRWIADVKMPIEKIQILLLHATSFETQSFNGFLVSFSTAKSNDSHSLVHHWMFECWPKLELQTVAYGFCFFPHMILIDFITFSEWHKISLISF